MPGFPVHHQLLEFTQTRVHRVGDAIQPSHPLSSPSPPAPNPYATTSNAEEAEVEWFYEDLQDLLELTPKKDVLFIIGDWNAKVGIKKYLE